MIASAQGKIIPSGRSKIVQPFETGVVRAIHVKDGQTVKAGDLLIELDPTISDAELRHLESDLAAAQLDVGRLRASLVDGDPLAASHPPDGAPAALLATERQLLIDQTGEHRAKLAALDRRRAQREAERATDATPDVRKAVTSGKTPMEYMFSELSQIADIGSTGSRQLPETARYRWD